MLQHLLYVASARQIEATKAAMTRLRAEPIAGSGAAVSAYQVKHAVLGNLVLKIHLLADLDGISPHLRQLPVDLLIYDEREGGIETTLALSRIRDDVAAFADLWGPDFLFPMSRVVAILDKKNGQAMRAFELGRVHVRDVLIDPRNTASVLRWVKDVLTKGIIREERIGVALSGGGVEGFLFQVGAVHALERAISGRSLQDCHVYSGVSSGAIGAALLAAKVPTVEVIRALHRKSELLPPLTSSTLFDLAGKDIVRRIVTESLAWKGLNPNKWVSKTLRSIPTGFFKGDALQDYFHRAIAAMGKNDSFKDLGTELYIGATDQDSFEHIVFGRQPWMDVPVSQALRASCALPPFFVPAQINGRYFVDGQVTRTCNIELVVERGCRLVFIIDPLKPLATTVPGQVDSQGGVYAMIQMVKALVYSRFEATLKHLTERYPDVDFIVFQPDEESAQLMAGSPMRYRIRTQIIQLAYRGTLRRLRERHQVYAAKLNRYGFHLCSIEELIELEREDAEIADSVA